MASLQTRDLRESPDEKESIEVASSRSRRRAVIADSGSVTFKSNGNAADRMVR